MGSSLALGYDFLLVKTALPNWSERTVDLHQFAANVLM